MGDHGRVRDAVGGGQRVRAGLAESAMPGRQRGIRLSGGALWVKLTGMVEVLSSVVLQRTTF